MKSVALSAALFFVFGTAAYAQVRVDAQLERTEYLQGEPVVVVVEVLNVGDEPLGYSSCGGDIRLNVVGGRRRITPNIFGCAAGLSSVVGCGSSGQRPLLAPGEAMTFRHLLTDYDLSPGEYVVSVSGKVGVLGQNGAVPGAQFDRTVYLTVQPATEEQLQRAFASLVSDADSTNPSVRYQARAAILESAPRFLEPLIAQLAQEDPSNLAAIDALGRIATPQSRAHLRELLERANDSRSSIVLALARGGAFADTELLARVLDNSDNDEATRQSAALGLGRIGGDEAVGRLERSFAFAPLGIRPTIARALGNTRSRLAVPVLVNMYGNNPYREDVCLALRTLTHRSWGCDGTLDDPAAKRRQGLRWWKENAASATIYGPEDCLEETFPAPDSRRTNSLLRNVSRPTTPVVTSVRPAVAFANAYVTLWGYGFRLEDRAMLTVVFRQGTVEHRIVRSGGGGPFGGVQYMDVVVPAAVTPGRWQIVVEIDGMRSAPVAFRVTAGRAPVLADAWPRYPHPSQDVWIRTRTPAQIGDEVLLTDAYGRFWRLAAGVSASHILFVFPDEVADGEATVRVGRTRDTGDQFSASLKLTVTSGPVPLPTTEMLKPVAPGQWTDLGYAVNEFELRRADRIEIEFRQNNRSVSVEPIGLERVHVQVPATLSPGTVRVRSRTWIEQTASEWSRATKLRVLTRAVAPSVEIIEAGPTRYPVWYGGAAAPEFVRAGEMLVLRGHFPVAGAADLMVQLRSAAGTVNLPASDIDAVFASICPRTLRRETGSW